MLTTKILEIFEKVEKLGLVQPINLARKKFISLLVLAMIQSRSVQFTELAAHMNTHSLDESNLRRIQDFIGRCCMNIYPLVKEVFRLHKFFTKQFFS